MDGKKKKKILKAREIVDMFQKESSFKLKHQHQQDIYEIKKKLVNERPDKKMFDSIKFSVETELKPLCSLFVSEFNSQEVIKDNTELDDFIVNKRATPPREYNLRLIIQNAVHKIFNKKEKFEPTETIYGQNIKNFKTFHMSANRNTPERGYLEEPVKIENIVEYSFCDCIEQYTATEYSSFALSPPTISPVHSYETLNPTNGNNAGSGFKSKKPWSFPI